MKSFLNYLLGKNHGKIDLKYDIKLLDRFLKERFGITFVKQRLENNLMTRIYTFPKDLYSSLEQKLENGLIDNKKLTDAIRDKTMHIDGVEDIEVKVKKEQRSFSKNGCNVVAIYVSSNAATYADWNFNNIVQISIEKTWRKDGCLLDVTCLFPEQEEQIGINNLEIVVELLDILSK